jgi:hypothetical protein
MITFTRFNLPRELRAKVSAAAAHATSHSFYVGRETAVVFPVEEPHSAYLTPQPAPGFVRLKIGKVYFTFGRNGSLFLDRVEVPEDWSNENSSQNLNSSDRL